MTRGRELRKAKRTPRRNAAWIVLDGGGTPVPCVLWDISDGGARIAAARMNSLPNVFGLFLTKDGKSRRYCRVVWRKEAQLGIRFIDETAANIELDPAPRYVRRKAVAVPPPAPKASPPADVTIQQLVLPGCGPRIASSRPALEIERRPLAVSSLALIMLVLLAAATGLFAFAGMQSDAPWTLQVCTSAKNFCQHPEWTGVAGAVMTVVYLAVRGMER